MKVPMVFFSLCLLAFTPFPTCAQAPASRHQNFGEIPPIILEGLHQLADQKPEDAEKAWFRGSTFEGQPFSGNLRLLFQSNGKYQNFDPVSIQDLTPRLRVIYLALNFEKQPAIVKFVVYRTLDGWVPLSRKLGIDEEACETVANLVAN